MPSERKINMVMRLIAKTGSPHRDVWAAVKQTNDETEALRILQKKEEEYRRITFEVEEEHRWSTGEYTLLPARLWS